MAKRKKFIHRKVGDVLKIDLGNNRYSYAQVMPGALAGFFYKECTEDVSIDEILNFPVGFIVGLYKDIITQGIFERVGKAALHPEFQKEPYFFTQDMISGYLHLYHSEFKDTNYECKATIAECENLECAAVWDYGNIIERLNEHYAGSPSKWLGKNEINFDKLPPDQK